MVLDIITCLAIVAFCAWGYFRGFVRGILSFVSVFVAIILSVLIARPLAGLLNAWFGWADGMASWFSGDGLDGIASNNGLLLLTLFIAVILFVGIMVGVFFLKRLIKRLRESSRAFNRIDSIAGFFFGVFRFMLIACVLSTVILLIDSAGTGIKDWLFGNSAVASWIYDSSLWIVRPMLTAINAAIFG